MKTSPKADCSTRKKNWRNSIKPYLGEWRVELHLQVILTTRKKQVLTGCSTKKIKNPLNKAMKTLMKATIAGLLLRPKSLNVPRLAASLSKSNLILRKSANNSD